MKLTTRARYGVRLMVELALNYGKGPLFLKNIAKVQNISEKYLSLDHHTPARSRFGEFRPKGTWG